MYQRYRKQIFITVAILIATNLVMLGLLLVPDLAFGTIDTEDSTHVDIPDKSIYDHIIYNNEVYFLTHDDNKNIANFSRVVEIVQLGKIVNGEHVIINENIINSTYLKLNQDNLPQFIGVYQDRIYINLIPLMSADGNTSTVFTIYDLQGNYIEIIRNQHIKPSNTSRSQILVIQGMIIGATLFYRQVFRSLEFKSQSYLFGQNLEDLSKPLMMKNTTGDRYELYWKNKKAYLINGLTNGEYQLQLLSADLSLTNISKFSMGDQTIQFGSLGRSQNFLFLSEDKIYKVTTQFTNGQTTINLNSTLDNSHYQVTYGFDINEIHLTDSGRFIILTGNYIGLDSISNQPQPYISFLRVVGNNIQKIKINTDIVPDGISGTIYNPIISNGSISFLFSQLIQPRSWSSRYYTSSLIIIEDGIQGGIFLEGISPVVQTNIVGLLLSLTYVLYTVIGNRKNRYPENLEYPKYK